MAEYPQGIYDRGQELINQIGTFWSTIFTDSDRISTMFQGYMLEAGQTYRRFLEYLATASSADCPVFAKDYWHYMIIKESELTTTTVNYGDDYVYGDTIKYGIRTTSSNHATKIPDNFVSASFIFDRIINPETSWSKGVDFKIQNKEIIFNNNPFDEDSLNKREVYDYSGKVIDREVGIWLYNAEFDLDYIWQHYGYAFGIFMESSTYYKDFINAIADAFLVGPSVASIEGLLQAMTGIPLVKEPVEKVETIIYTRIKTQVITDKNVYTYNSDVNVIVNKGDILYAGEPLTDSLQIFELFRDMPSKSEFPALVLGKDFIAGDYSSELVAENKSVPLNYIGPDSDGKVIVSFEVSGREADVDKFWQKVHNRGKAEGKVLAEYLDTRDNPVTAPIPQYLPDTINPMQFFIKELMSNNLFIIRLKVNDFAIGSPGVGWFKALRRIMSPQTTYIVYVEFSPENEYINLEDNEENIELFEATDSVEDELEETIFFESILLREVSDC